MADLNEKTYDFLNNIITLVAKLGMPLILTAWLLVFTLAILMILVLRRYCLRKIWAVASVVGAISLAAHMMDFFGTLRMSPDLAFEANPIWCIVVEKLGLGLAKWYGFTGKLLLAILSFEFFSYYLVQRDSLMPAQASGFLSFWQDFGRKDHGGKILHLANITNFFAFLFGLIGPFCFYIVALNGITSEKVYMNLPSMPIMLVLYIFTLTLAYLVGNYCSYRRSVK